MAYAPGVVFAALILGLLLLVSVFAFTPIARTPLAGTIRTFVAFYLVLLGLALIFGQVEQESRDLLGALFAALGLTYFWVTLRRDKS